MIAKLCPKCGLMKSADDFYKVGDGRSLDSKCKACKLAAYRAWKKTPRGKMLRKVVKRKWEKSDSYRASRKTVKAKAKEKRAKARYLVGRGKETAKRWRQTPKGRAVLKRMNAKRKMLIAGTLNNLTAAEWQQIKTAHNQCCHYCKKKLPLTQDHVIPLTKGGAHTRENVVPACLRCNVRKSNKIVTLF